MNARQTAKKLKAENAKMKQLLDRKMFAVEVKTARPELLRYKLLNESTPISIGIDGTFVGSFTDHGCIPAAFLEYKVTSLWIGESNTGEKKFNITISKKEES